MFQKKIIFLYQEQTRCATTLEAGERQSCSSFQSSNPFCLCLMMKGNIILKHIVHSAVIIKKVRGYTIESICYSFT